MYGTIAINFLCNFYKARESSYEPITISSKISTISLITIGVRSGTRDICQSAMAYDTYFFFWSSRCSFMFTDDADRPRASINRPVPLLASWLVGWLVLMRQVHRISPLPTNPRLTELVLFSERSPFAIHLPRYSRGQRFESSLLPRQSDGPSVGWAKKKKKQEKEMKKNAVENQRRLCSTVGNYNIYKIHYGSQVKCRN